MNNKENINNQPSTILLSDPLFMRDPCPLFMRNPSINETNQPCQTQSLKSHPTYTKKPKRLVNSSNSPDFYF